MADMAEDESVVLTALGACPNCGCYENRPVLLAPPNIPENPSNEPKQGLECHCGYRWLISTAAEDPYQQQIIVHQADCPEAQ